METVDQYAWAVHRHEEEGGRKLNQFVLQNMKKSSALLSDHIMDYSPYSILGIICFCWQDVLWFQLVLLLDNSFCEVCVFVFVFFVF